MIKYLIVFLYLIVFFLLTSCAQAQLTRSLQSPNGHVHKDSMSANIVAAIEKSLIPIGVDGKQYMLTTSVSGTQQAVTGSIPYWGNSSFNWLFQLAIGTMNYVLTSNGSVPVWTNPALIVPTNSVINNPDATTSTTHNSIYPTVDAVPLWLNTATDGSANILNCIKNVTGSSTTVLTIDANGNLVSNGNITATGSLNSGTSSILGALYLNDGLGHTAGFEANPTSMMGNVTWALPAADGTSGYVLSTNGSGALSWVANGAGLTNPMTTTGDIIYSSNNSGTPARLGIGTNTTVLHGGATPSYSQIVNGDITNATINLTTKVTGSLPVASGGTGLATLTAHNVLLGNGTGTLNFAPPVASKYVLTDNGTGSDPTFQALPSSTTTAQTIEIDNVQTTTADALTVTNTTNATSTQVQWSPALALHTTGWKTNATAGAQSVDGLIEMRPRTNATSPDAEMMFSVYSNGTADTIMSLWRDYSGSQPVLSLGSGDLTGGILQIVPAGGSGTDGGNFEIQSQDGVGSNHFGGNLDLKTGRTTGNKLGSAVKFFSNFAGGSGSTINAYSQIGQVVPTAASAAKLQIGTASSVTGTLEIANSATAFVTDLVATQPTATRTITFPNATGTVALTSGANVSSVSGTTNQVTVSPTTGACVVSLPTSIITAGTSATTQIIQAGASASGTDQNGGALDLKSGTTTGAGESDVNLYMGIPQATGTGSHVASKAAFLTYDGTNSAVEWNIGGISPNTQGEIFMYGPSGGNGVTIIATSMASALKTTIQDPGSTSADFIVETSDNSGSSGLVATWSGTRGKLVATAPTKLLTSGAIGSITQDGTGITASSVAGSDVAGVVTMTAATSITGGTCTVTFGTAYASAPIVLLTAATSGADANLTTMWVTSTTTTFVINFSALTAATNFKVNYFVVK